MNGPSIAFVLGATGLVGQEIVRGLGSNPQFSQIYGFVRKTGALERLKITTNERIKERLVNFALVNFTEDADFASWFSSVQKGDRAVLFSALGTTLKQAGSQNAQYLVDYTYQLEVAKAFRNVTQSKGAPSTYVLISSAGASSKSRLFYPRMKGQLEDQILNLGFDKTRILRPSLLLGQREHQRFGEEIAAKAYHLVERLGIRLPPKARPISASAVAKAAVGSALTETPGYLIFQPIEQPLEEGNQ